MGTMHQDIKKLFPNAMYFGFTGTPVIKEKGDIAEDNIYTSDIFGNELHRYTIYHGIRDNNILGFDTYIANTFDEKELRKRIGLEKCHETTVEEALENEEKREIFLYYMNQGKKKCPMTEIEKELPKNQYKLETHKKEVVKNIIENWPIRSINSKFHAILATSSIQEAIKYYKLFKQSNTILKITAIFDPSDNNSNTAIEKIEGITEIQTDSIDDDYMNSKFEIYIKTINKGNQKLKEKALDELNKTFPMLSAAEQKYARIFLHQVESGEIIIDKNKTFHEHITELRAKYNNDYIHQISQGLGINEEKFRDLITSGATLENLNAFGRYDELLETLDITKAQAYFENRDQKSYSLRETRLQADQEITSIILNGGVDGIVD